ncbi:MAG TPA: DUF1254 domain-containing protein [Caulobacteraceae bacterium]|jgi:hypothetical protein|nr:DUF1254 domain-containing protein [Caulobacteraceae bacterium]
MDRRGFVLSGAALAALARVSWPGRALATTTPPVAPEDLRSAAREAWLYGLPLVEAARLRAAAIGDRPQEGKAGFNSFLHQRTPAGPDLRDVSAPEPDVLYSSGWIHLGGGPARISVPATGGRYFSLALFDLYGNVLGSVEGREASKNGHDITVIGPPPRVGMAGYYAPAPRMPAMHKMIHARSLWVWALARTHLEGGEDLAAAHKLQDGLEIRVKPDKTPPIPAGPVARDAPWSDYLFAVQQLINENPPPQDDVNFFRRIAPVQVGIEGGFEKARFADVETAEIAKGAAEATVLASRPPAIEAAGGWTYPKDDLGAFGQDFLYRAQIALTQPGSLRPQAVTCLHAAGAGGRNISGAARHRLVMPAPPADGFWSLTLYEPQPDGRLFLTHNPIDRYSVSGWTPGLRRRADGAVEIVISRSLADRGPNWLPAPANGPFALILRAYAPGEPILQRRYRPPPLETL